MLQSEDRISIMVCKHKLPPCSQSKGPCLAAPVAAQHTGWAFLQIFKLRLAVLITASNPGILLEVISVQQLSTSQHNPITAMFSCPRQCCQPNTSLRNTPHARLQWRAKQGLAQRGDRYAAHAVNALHCHRASTLDLMHAAATTTLHMHGISLLSRYLLHRTSSM